MMVSGLVLFYNYRTIDEFDTKSFTLKNKIYHSTLYYLVYYIFFLYPPHFAYNLPMTGEKLQSIWRVLLLGEAYSHLYFIFLIFQFYIVLPLIIKYLGKPMREKPFKVFAFFFYIPRKYTHI